MKKIILVSLLFLAQAVFAVSPTHIADTWLDTSNNPVTGTLTVSWPAFTASDGSQIAGGRFSYAVANGVVSLYLLPNAGATPNQLGAASPPVYTAGFYNPAVPSTTYSTWSVPISSGAVTLSQILCTNSTCGTGTQSTAGTINSASAGQFAYYGINGSILSGHTLALPDFAALMSGVSATSIAGAVGPFTANDCVKWNSNGDIVDAGAPCGSSSGSSGTVTSGTIGQFAYYGSSGTVVGGRTLVAGDIPTLSYDASGAAAAATATALQKANNLGDVVSAATARANLGLGSAATQNTSAFQAPLTFTGSGSKTASSTGTTTTNNCAKWDASGNVIDAGAPCGSGSTSGTVNSGTSGQFAQYSGAGTAVSGHTLIASDIPTIPTSGISGLATSATTDTTNASNISSGTLSAARLPLTAVVTGSATGSGSKYASATAAGVSNNCAKWDGSGNIADAGSPCGSGSGGISAPGTTTVGNVPQYSNTSGSALSTGLGVVTAVGSPGANTNVPTEQAVRAAIAAISGLLPTFSGSSGLYLTTNGSVASWTDIITGPSGALCAGVGCSGGTPGIVDIVTSVVPTKAGANDFGGHNRYLSPMGFQQQSSSYTPSSGFDNAYFDGSDTLHVVNSGGADIPLTGHVLQASTHVAHGDSITVGYLACAIASTTSPQCAYDTLMAADERTTLVMEATSGYTSCDIDATQTFIKDLPLSPQGMDFSPIYTYLIGTNDANNKGVGSYEAGVFQPCHKAMIAWDAIANKYDITSTSNTGICTNTGTWTYQAGGGGSNWAMPNDYTVGTGATKTCPITSYGNPLYFWYFVQDGQTGTFTYAVDGGSAVTVNNATSPAIASNRTYAWISVRIPVAAGTHSVVFTNVNATGSGAGNLNLMGLGTPPLNHYYNEPKVFVSGVPKPQYNLNSGSSSPFASYDADALADVQSLAADGMSVYFVNVRNFLCTGLATVGGVANSCVNNQGIADMNTSTVDPQSGSGGTYSLHPNIQGHIDIKRAFEAVMQYTPYVKPYSGSGASTATTTGSTTTNDCAKWDVNGNVVDAGSPCGSGSTAFSALTAGTNTGAAMLVGSGASLGVTGSGTIAATSVPVTGVASLTFTGNTTKAASSTGSTTLNDCAKWDANGNIIDAGAACGTSSLPSTVVQTNQTNTYSTGTQDFTLAAHTIPAKAGLLSAIPATCTVGELYFATNATAGQNLYECAATNFFTQQLNSGSGGTLPNVTNLIAGNGSGSGADSGIAPATVCTLTKYPILYSALTGAASTTPVVTVATLASTSVRICYLEISGTTSFAGTSITSGTVRLQSGAGTPMLYSPNQDVFGTVGATTNNYWSDAGSSADRTNQTVSAAFTFNASSANLTAGAVDIVLGVRTRP